MKLPTLSRWTIRGAAGLIGVLLLQSSWAQEPDNSSPLRADGGSGGRRIHAVNQRYEGWNDAQPANPNDPWAAGPQVVLREAAFSGSGIRKAAEELRDAKDEATKKAAEVKLRELLEKYFDADMKRREAELRAMDTRLRKLQEQLTKRHEKMQEIVDLQIKVLINEADGLGFFSGNSGPPNGLPPAPNPYFFYSPRTAEEGRSIIEPALPPQPTPAQPPQPAPTRQPALPRIQAAPIPTEREPSPPLEPSVAPESR